MEFLNFVLKFLLFNSFCGIALCNIHYDYYWRDYTGEVPEDAFAAGFDVNNETTYIGQAYIENYGIIPVEIYPGKETLVANIEGLHNVDNFVKILCTSTPDSFIWIPTDSENLHVQLINKHLVQVGVEYGYVTNIGRVQFQNEIVLGRVIGYNIGDAQMYFVSERGIEGSAKSYEVLVYDPNINKKITTEVETNVETTTGADE